MSTITNLKVSIATLDDLPEMADVINTCFVGDKAYGSWSWTDNSIRMTGKRTTSDLLKQQIRENPVKTFILKCTETEEGGEKGRIVGCTICQEEGDAMTSEMLTVLPDLQGAGIGSMILKRLEQLAKIRGAKRILITVVKKREALMRWYEGKGFRPTGVESVFIPPNEDICITDEPLDLVEMAKNIE